MRNHVAFVLIMLLAESAPLGAYTFMTGYSGAPGSYGLCARTCHGTPGGTITVTGFPARYQPGQTYTIKVYGDSIRQFNGSCRVGQDTLNAGTIEAGYNTEVYNVFGETNGIHLLAPSSDSGEFFWTAPQPGVDTVRLYIAGEQGFLSWGPNTELVFVSADITGVEQGQPDLSPPFGLPYRVVPNPLVPFSRVPGHEKEVFLLYDISGRKIGSCKGDCIGVGLPGGVYFLKPEGKGAKPLQVIKLK